jgi:acyl carrier protein
VDGGERFPVERVRRFLRDVLIEDPSLPLSSDEPIFSSGLLDSLAVVRLMHFLESEFDVRIPATEVSLDDFDTLARIDELVSRLVARRPPR